MKKRRKMPGMVPRISSVLIIVLVVVDDFWMIDGCNEAVCGSIVSKCLLTKSCNCDSATRVCFKECFNCLGLYYTDCCSCVGLCPESSELEILNKTSIVEDFPDPIPQLFEALTQGNEQNDWTTEVFPVDLTITKGTDPVTLSMNCTVAFLNQCSTGVKCKSMCLSMGSSSYRWFHNGCCECVGERCINYGLDKSRCQNCPRTESDEEFIDENDLEYDYDEDVDTEEMVGEDM